MTDEAERKVRQWARKRNGDPLTPEDVVDLVLAVDEDADHRHDETLRMIAEHVVEANVRDARIAELEDKFRTATLTCQQRVLDIVKSEHNERHSEHMDSHHPAPARRENDVLSADFSNVRKSILPDPIAEMTMGWRLGKWLLMLVVIGLVGWGLPFWADSCASRQAEGDMQQPDDPHGLVAPATPSPTP